MWFLVEFLNEQTMVDEPDRLIPFQLWYEHNPSPFQFKVEIYLNKTEECFNDHKHMELCFGKTSIVEDMKVMYAAVIIDNIYKNPKNILIS